MEKKKQLTQKNRQFFKNKITLHVHFKWDGGNIKDKEEENV